MAIAVAELLKHMTFKRERSQVQWLESVIWQQKKKLQRKKVLSIFSWLKVFKKSFLHSLNQNAFNCAD
jgi:hypothetical protein